MRAVYDIRRKSVKCPGEESEEEEERAAKKKRKGLNGASVRINRGNTDDVSSLEEVDDNDDDDDDGENDYDEIVYDEKHIEESSINSTIDRKSPTGHVFPSSSIFSVIVSEENFVSLLELFRKRKLEGLPLSAISSHLGSLSFPQRLYILLEIESSDCVGWTMNGTAFLLHNTERFMKEICPIYFSRKYPL